VTPATDNLFEALTDEERNLLDDTMEIAFHGANYVYIITEKE
jgi:hypothetical protein